MPVTLGRERFEVKKLEIVGKSLKGNTLKDPAKREIIVLERNVKESTPALIGLAGFFGSSNSFLNRSYTGHDFFRALETISEKKSSSFLILLPDTMTSYYGNQFVNSSAVGNYEDFIVNDVVGLIKRKYGNRKIGLFGKSSGGFGSYNLATKHPDVFGGFVDVSGDSGFEYCYVRDFAAVITKLGKMNPQEFLKYFDKKPHPDNLDFGVMNVLAMAAFYSPNNKSKFGFDLPFDLKYHTFRQDVWNRWLLLDPLRNLENRLDSLRQQKVILQVGNRDEFSINIGMKGMSELMNKHKVKHDYKEFDEGHFGLEYLYEESIPSLINALS